MGQLKSKEPVEPVSMVTALLFAGVLALASVTLSLHLAARQRASAGREDPPDNVQELQQELRRLQDGLEDAKNNDPFS